MTMQEIVKALRCCEHVESGCESCQLCDEPITKCFDLRGKAADLIEFLTVELETTCHQLEQVKQERDAWKLRAEAAERDLHGIIRYAEDDCKLCAHHHPCAGKDCPKYESGTGLVDEGGVEYPDWKWTCEDFDYGTCPMLEDTPCNGCDFQNHWKWRGPCAENEAQEEKT